MVAVSALIWSGRIIAANCALGPRRPFQSETRDARQAQLTSFLSPNTHPDWSIIHTHSTARLVQTSVTYTRTMLELLYTCVSAFRLLGDGNDAAADIAVTFSLFHI